MWCSVFAGLSKLLNNFILLKKQYRDFPFPLSVNKTVKNPLRVVDVVSSRVEFLARNFGSLRNHTFF